MAAAAAAESVELELSPLSPPPKPQGDIGRGAGGAGSCFKASFIVFSACMVALITQGTRGALGLFVKPLSVASEVPVAPVSLALAVGQFIYGAIQPLAGGAADRCGPYAVLLVSQAVGVAGLLAARFLLSTAGLVVSLGVLFSAGAGATGYSCLFSAMARALPERHHGMANGVINAGGSLGSFVWPPICQHLLDVGGFQWGLVGSAVYMGLAALFVGLLKVATAGCASKAPSAATVPVQGPRKRQLDAQAKRGGGDAGHRNGATEGSAQQQQEGERSLWAALRASLRSFSYVMLHLAFFTCGFHIAFVTTHLPQEVALQGVTPSVASWSLSYMGLANVGGSLLAGWLVGRVKAKYVLAVVYGSRSLIILFYLLSARDSASIYAMSVFTGISYLATVPPTVALCGTLFGTKNLGLLFGLTLVSHQVGGFIGAYAGGLAFDELGDLFSVWVADAALGLLAVTCCLLIKEERAE